MPDAHQNATNAAPALTFTAGDQTYAFLIADVVEVAAIVALTTLPDAPPVLLGLANRHGDVLPVLDFRTVMGRSAGEVDAETLFIVVGDDTARVGVVVDDVLGVEYLPLAENRVTAASSRYVRDIISVDDRLIQIAAVPPLITLGTLDHIAQRGSEG